MLASRLSFSGTQSPTPEQALQWQERLPFEQDHVGKGQKEDMQIGIYADDTQL